VVDDTKRSSRSASVRADGLSQEARLHAQLPGHQREVPGTHLARPDLAADRKREFGRQARVQARAHQVVERRQGHALARHAVDRQVLGVAVVVANVQVEEHPTHQVAQVDGGLRAVATDQFGAGGQAWAAFLLVLAVRHSGP